MGRQVDAQDTTSRQGEAAEKPPSFGPDVGTDLYDSLQQPAAARQDPAMPG